MRTVKVVQLKRVRLSAFGMLCETLQGRKAMRSVHLFGEMLAALFVLGLLKRAVFFPSPFTGEVPNERSEVRRRGAVLAPFPPPSVTRFARDIHLPRKRGRKIAAACFL